MSPSDSIQAEAALFRRWAENTDESASVALLLHLCRESPGLRHWLWEDFGRNAAVRERLAGMVKGRSALEAKTFAELTDERGALHAEVRRLRRRFSTAIYGGLTWNQITSLIRHYEAGRLDLGAFVLAQDWRAAGKPSPRLIWAGVEFLDLLLTTGRRRLLKNLDRAIGLLKRCEPRQGRRAALGYSDWWKLRTLSYMLHHPKPSYSVRELRTYLGTLGLKPAIKDLRRFCTRHGIRRDMSAGRPRTRRWQPVAA